MIVKDYAEKNPNVMLRMMTPCGYLNILTNDLLNQDSVKTNPGCPGYDMSIETSEILDMDIVDMYKNEKGVFMLIGNE